MAHIDLLCNTSGFHRIKFTSRKLNSVLESPSCFHFLGMTAYLEGEKNIYLCTRYAKLNGKQNFLYIPRQGS